MKEPATQLKTPPEDGCYIQGLFLEGACWNKDKWVLAESKPLEMFSEMPVVHLIPQAAKKASSQQMYTCPVYKTLERKGKC